MDLIHPVRSFKEFNALQAKLMKEQAPTPLNRWGAGEEFHHDPTPREAEIHWVTQVGPRFRAEHPIIPE